MEWFVMIIKIDWKKDQSKFTKKGIKIDWKRITFDKSDNEILPWVTRQPNICREVVFLANLVTYGHLIRTQKMHQNMIQWIQKQRKDK